MKIRVCFRLVMVIAGGVLMVSSVVLADTVGETLIVGSGDAACGGSSSGSTCRHPHISGKMSSRAMIPAVTAPVRDRTCSREAIRVR